MNAARFMPCEKRLIYAVVPGQNIAACDETHRVASVFASAPVGIALDDPV
jgi:hypothetical protein